MSRFDTLARYGARDIWDSQIRDTLASPGLVFVLITQGIQYPEISEKMQKVMNEITFNYYSEKGDVPDVL